MAKKSMTEYMQKRNSMQLRKDEDPPKGRASTLSIGKANTSDSSNVGRFNFKPKEVEEKSSKGLRANNFITDEEAKSKRAALAKDLRLGKITKAEYDKGMTWARTANDVQNVKDNAGGSGVKNQRGGSCTPAETRSRSCGKPGKGF